MKKKENTQNNDKPEIFTVKKFQNKKGVSRRDFIGLGLGTGSLLGGMSRNVFAEN